MIWKFCGSFGLTPVAPQQPVREAVERADPQVLNRHLEQRLDAAAHLRGGLVREGHGQQALRCDVLDVDQPGCAMHEYARLAAARSGDDEGRLCRRRHGFALGIIQGFENRGDVHEARKCSRNHRELDAPKSGVAPRDRPRERRLYWRQTIASE